MVFAAVERRADARRMRALATMFMDEAIIDTLLANAAQLEQEAVAMDERAARCVFVDGRRFAAEGKT